MPTDREIADVKAWAKNILDNIGWDVCADMHWTPEMNEKIAPVMNKLAELQSRIQEEIDRVGNECLTEAGYWELYDEFQALNSLMSSIIFFTVPGIGDPNLKLPAGYFAVTSPNGMVYDNLGQPTGKHVTDYMTEEMREAYFKYGCFYLGGLSGQISCNNMYYAVEGLQKTMASITEPCYEKQLTIARVRDGLDIRVWYCGYPLGY